MGFPGAVFGNSGGWVSPAPSTSGDVDPVITLTAPPLMVDMGTQVGYQNFIALDPFNAFSIELDGVDETLTTPHDATLDFEWDDPFSLSCWFKAPSQGSWQGLFGKMDPGNDYRGYWMVMYQGRVGLLLCSNWSGGSGNAALPYTTSSSFDDNTWHHAVCTTSGAGTSAGVTIYIDGVSQSKTNYYLSNINGNSMTNTEPFVLGTGWGLSSYYFDGNIDEVSVWNKELSAGEVGDIYNGGDPNDLLTHSATANLKAWWRMGDGDNGAGVHDSSNSSDASARIY